MASPNPGLLEDDVAEDDDFWGEPQPKFDAIDVEAEPEVVAIKERRANRFKEAVEVERAREAANEAQLKAQQAAALLERAKNLLESLRAKMRVQEAQEVEEKMAELDEEIDQLG